MPKDNKTAREYGKTTKSVKEHHCKIIGGNGKTIYLYSKNTEKSSTFYYNIYVQYETSLCSVDVVQNPRACTWVQTVNVEQFAFRYAQLYSLVTGTENINVIGNKFHQHTGMHRDGCTVRLNRM